MTVKYPSQPMRRAFVTKWVLEQGIKECYGEWDAGTPDRFTAKLDENKKPLSYSMSCWGLGKEWHDTREAAVRRAEDVRDRKVRAHQKHVAKLLDIEFS